MDETDYDLCVIGGGINGTAIARDAAGRGLSVLLVEKGDLASATSSASTKLIHGGLRYLEYFEFGLVRKSLKEREVLRQIAPHIIKPLEFILPYESGLRPAFLIRMGLFLYDFLGGKKTLPASKALDLRRGAYGAALQDSYKKGFSYMDCRVDDSRLVILNAMGAREKGADILIGTKCVSLESEPDHWLIHLEDVATGNVFEKTASMVVNATGPWVRKLLDDSSMAHGDTPDVRLVKGSHIIVPKLFEGKHAYILQQPDKRIVFAIPYEGSYTLIGTTEVDYSGDPSKVSIEQQEIDYLCRAINRSFKKQIGESDIIRNYSGVRPLLDDGQDSATSVTRDYHLELSDDGHPPLLSVFGGKITTYRTLAEQAVNILCDKPAWTKSARLPGGDFPEGDSKAFFGDQKKRYPWLPEDVLRRYMKSYGTLMSRILEDCTCLEDLGGNLGDGVYEAEIEYLVKYEWAQTAEDILWRRSKLGLHVGRDTIENLEEFLMKWQEGPLNDEHGP